MVSNFKYLFNIWGARGRVVGWSTMLQAGRLWVRFLIRLLDFLIDLIVPAATMSLGSTQPLTEISTRNLLGGKGRSARKTDKLTANCEPIIWKMWEPRRLKTLWASMACYRIVFYSFNIWNYIVLKRDLKISDDYFVQHSHITIYTTAAFTVIYPNLYNCCLRFIKDANNLLMY
jgi:hypothetical protein